MSICVSVSLSACLTVRQCLHPSFGPCVHLPVDLCLCLSDCMSVCLSVRLSVNSSVCLLVHTPLRLSICFSLNPWMTAHITELVKCLQHLNICLRLLVAPSVRQSVRRSVCLSVCSPAYICQFACLSDYLASKLSVIRLTICLSLSLYMTAPIRVLPIATE